MILTENPEGEKKQDPALEEKKETVQEQEISPGDDQNPDVTDVFSEQVVKEHVEKKSDINLADFKVDSFESNEKKDAPADQPKNTTSSTKNDAVARGAKPSTLVLVGDIMLARIGAAFSKNPKEYWRFSKEDKDDLSILAEETAREGDYSSIPSKWLLIGVLAMIILAKVMTRNNPDNQPGKKIVNSEYEIVLAQTKARAEADKDVSLLRDQVEALREQNKLLMGMLAKRKGPEDDDIAEILEETKNHKIEKHYKGYDLSKISFTERGALIDPSMAGQPGYTPEGKKMGNISKDHIDLREKWTLWREKYKREFINAEPA